VFTTASRIYLGFAAVAAVLGIAYSVTSDTGLDGSSPEWSGTIEFAGLLFAAIVMAVALIVTRDADVPAPTDDAKPVLSPGSMATQPSTWPIFAAIGTGFLLVGTVAGIAWTGLGVALLGAAVLESAALSWSERLSGDPAFNRAQRARTMLPMEIPLTVAAGAAVIAISLSRVLLAVSVDGAVAVAAVVAILVLSVGTFVALRPAMSAGAVQAAAVVGAAVLLAGGVIGAIVGEREIEGHGAEHADEAGSNEESSLFPPARGEAGDGQTDDETDHETDDDQSAAAVADHSE